MDHAEAMARMADAVAAPGGLTSLVADPSSEADAVRQHVRGCPECAAEWRAWSVVSMGLSAAAPDELQMRPAARDQILDPSCRRLARRQRRPRPRSPLRQPYPRRSQPRQRQRPR